MSTLVFLSGWGYRSSVFSTFIEKLNQHKLLATDVPVMQENHIDDILLQFADSLPQHSILIGWSLGGIIATELCARFPDRFRKLVLLGSATQFARDDFFFHKMATDFASTMHYFHRLTCFPDSKIKTYMSAHLAGESMQDSLITNLRYLFRTDLRAVLPRLTQPVLSLAGEQDAIMKNSPPQSIMLRHAGHAFPFTHTNTVCDHILDFIEQPA